MTVGLNNSLPPTSDTAINLLNYAMSHESFEGSEYVIFNDSDYSYYIVWGDLEKSSDSVVGTDIEYIHYYRTSASSGYNYQYLYEYGTDTTFNLTLSSQYISTSNIPTVGFYMPQTLEVETNGHILGMLTLAVSMLFAIMIKVFKGVKT